MGYPKITRFAISAFAFVAASCAAKPILIGVPIVQTGIRSGIGVSARNGMELAKREINASGGIKGRPLELLVRDDKDDADEAARVDAELIEAGAVALVGHMASVSAIKSVALANERRVPIVSPTISSTDYSGKDDYFLRIIGTNSDMGRSLGEWAAASGLRSIGVMVETSNEAFTRPFFDGFAEIIRESGGNIAAFVNFQSSSGTNYAAILESLMSAADLDAIFCAGSAFDTASLCQALAKRARNQRAEAPRVLATMWSLTEELMRFGGRTIEGVVLVGYFDAGNSSPAYQEFSRAYRATFDEEPDFAAVYGYDALRVVARALAECKQPSGPALREAILRIGEFPGLQEPIPIDRFGDSRRRPTIFTVAEGRFVKVR